MAKTRKVKKQILEDYKKRLGESKVFVVVEPKQLNPNEVNKFRRELFDHNAKFNTIKNSVFKLALKDANIAEMPELNYGEHAVLFMEENFVDSIKLLKKFIDDTVVNKTEKRVQIVTGVMDGEIISKELILELADMPSKEVSISQILGILDMALSGVVNVLEDSVKSYVSILDQKFNPDNQG